MTFQPHRNRDAWATIRGYVYQVQLTIDRWLHLDQDQVLELERGEDIDVISGWAAEGAADEQRLLEQIKHLEGSITLNSPDVKTALATFVEHRAHNSGEDLRFRLVTTARIGCERNKGTKHIEGWEAIRSGTAAGQGCLRTLAGIRSILRRGTRPKDLLQETWDAYQRFLRAAHGPEVLSLVLAFEWSTGQSEPEDLRIAIERELRARGWALSEAQAEEQYEALFVDVFHRLGVKGIKRLTAADRDEVLARRTLSTTDRKVLEDLDAVMARLEKLEAKLDDHDEAIEQLQMGQRAMIESLARAHGIRSTISTVELPPDLGLPPGASARAARVTTVASLLDALKSLTWLGIHGTSGSGKTELALLVAQAAGSGAHWLSLRDLSEAEALGHLSAALLALAGRAPGPQRVTWYEAVCAQLGRGHVVVLDDLPAFEADSPLGVQLARLASVFGRRGLKLLTTSASAIPSRLCARLGDAMVQSVAAPRFTDDEVAELLRVHGAPPEWQDPRRLWIIAAITDGHAELIVTAVFFLRQHNWRYSEKELDGLLRGGYASGVERDAMRRLLTTVPDETTRQLLFRVALFKRSFTVDDVRVIADVTPPVGSPRQHLTRLEGLWLQRDRGGHFLVCPLVKAFGAELPKSTWRAVHDAMGLLLVRRHQISPTEMRYAVDHFVAAEEYDRAGTGMLLAMQAFYDKGVPEHDAGLTEVWANAPLPASMDLVMRIYLRTLQAAVRSRAGHSVEWLLRDLAALTEQDTDARSSAALTLLPHVTLLAAHDFAQCSRYIRRAIQVQFSAIMPNGQPLELPDGLSAERFLWHQSKCIKSEADLQDWARTLRSLTPEQLDRLTSDEFYYEIFSITLTEQFRLLEAEAPGRLGGWSKVDDALVDLAKIGEELGMDLLEASAQRQRIILRANHLKQFDDAVALAERTLACGPLRPACQMLILECTGCICFEVGRMDDARRYLTRAVALPTGSYTLLRIQALLYASRAAEPDRDLVFRYMDEALGLAQHTNWVPKTTVAQALGERALLAWVAGGLQDAVPALSNTLETLLACKPEGDDYKELTVILGNAMSYFLQLAGGKIPVGHDNEPLPPPARGAFLGRNSARLQDYDPVRVATLPVAMAMLADRTFCDDLVIRWATQGARATEKTRKPDTLAQVQPYLAVNMILNADYHGGLRLSFAAVARIMAVGFSAQTHGKPNIDADLDVEAVLGSRSSSRWREVELVVLRMLVVPAIFHVADKVLSDRTHGTNLTAQLIRELEETGQESADCALWQTIADIVRVFLDNDSSTQAIARAVSDDDAANDVARVVARICLSLQEGRSCAEVVGDQLATVSYALRNCSAFAFRQLVTPFVTNYWVNLAQKQPFRFSPPALAQEEIMFASREPVPRRAKAVLRAAIPYLGIRGITPHVHAWLRGP